MSRHREKVPPIIDHIMFSFLATMAGCASASCCSSTRTIANETSSSGVEDKPTVGAGDSGHAHVIRSYYPANCLPPRGKGQQKTGAGASGHANATESDERGKYNVRKVLSGQIAEAHVWTLSCPTQRCPMYQGAPEPVPPPPSPLLPGSPAPVGTTSSVQRRRYSVREPERTATGGGERVMRGNSSD